MCVSVCASVSVCECECGSYSRRASWISWINKMSSLFKLHARPQAKPTQMRCTNKPTNMCMSPSLSLTLCVCVCLCVCAIHMCWSFVALLCVSACVCAGAAKLISSWGIVKYINIVHFGSTSSPRCTAPQQHSIPPPQYTHRHTERKSARHCFPLWPHWDDNGSRAGVVRRVGHLQLLLLQLKSMVFYGNLWGWGGELKCRIILRELNNYTV